MTSIGIRELRQNASRYIAMAKSGERVAVTEHGKLVAYLVPASTDASVLDRLEAAGQYRPPSGSLLELGPPSPLPAGAPALSEVLAAMRDEERW